MFQILSILIAILLQPSSCGGQYQHLEIFGNRTLGYYYTYFNLGSPPQQQSVLIDTGSSLTVIPCSTCRYCDGQRISKLYNQVRSFSSSKMKCSSHAPICLKRCRSDEEFCQFYINYLDGSNVIGNIIEDDISFDKEGKNVFKGNFGCIQFENEATDLKANGVMGLDPSPTNNILYKWFGEQSDREPEFSVCLGWDGGYFDIGRSPIPDKYDVKVNYESKKQYSISGITEMQFGKISVFNQSIYRRYGFILDTGSTVSYFPSVQAKKLKAEVMKICQKIRKNCIRNERIEASGCFVFNFTRRGDEQRKLKELDSQFPPIEIKIDDQTIFWPPHNYLQISGEDQSYGSLICLRVQPQEQKTPFYLIGDNFLRGKKVTFNLKEQTIGIVDNQTCKYESNMMAKSSNINFLKNFKQVFLNFIGQYWIYIVAIVALLFLVFQKKIGNICTLMAQKFNRLFKKKKDELQEESVPQPTAQEGIENASVVSSVDERQPSEQVISKK